MDDVLKAEKHFTTSISRSLSIKCRMKSFELATGNPLPKGPVIIRTSEKEMSIVRSLSIPVTNPFQFLWVKIHA